MALGVDITLPWTEGSCPPQHSSVEALTPVPRRLEMWPLEDRSDEVVRVGGLVMGLAPV